MHQYRTHTCNQLRIEDVGAMVRLSGWIHRKRDHGGLLFIDLRDHYGITQVVVSDVAQIESLSRVRLESVVRIDGKVVAREPGTINQSVATGYIEVSLENFDILSDAEQVPVGVSCDSDLSEESRYRYRYLDLRREKLHSNIMLRSRVIARIRQLMHELGFSEFQTPILTASSPEGARDFLVPSRLHPGKFYALPQAPQQFKQLLMVAGFDRYFQIAPCFRDEDARADRSPGEFYQLDLEMSFATQDEIFAVLEHVLSTIFREFSQKPVTEAPYPRITYREAMEKYGTDKPDLRNPLLINDVTEFFVGSDFAIFAKQIADGAKVKAIAVENVHNNPRNYFDKLNEWAQSQKMAGLGYIIYADDRTKGPIAKFLTAERLQGIRERCGMHGDGAVFFVCSVDPEANAGLVRRKLGENLLADEFRFCWIVDYPMYELNDGKIDFSHNPFSMPQGGLESLNTKDPLDILAYQYDIVCNGYELSSGAIRNHSPEIMIKAFEIAGYTREETEENFKGMMSAFRYGAPPHGGAAPGIDRIVMLLAEEENIREVIAFPLNQNAEDLMLCAPSCVGKKQLQDLHIKVCEQKQG